MGMGGWLGGGDPYLECKYIGHEISIKVSQSNMAVKKFLHAEKQSSFANFSLENAFEPGILSGNTITGYRGL